jgi:peptidoglycan/xylan/chitin deacetylase (PgdA/CDA1 family)
MESAYEYGSRVGFWRLMRVFAERQVIPTIYAVGMALERNPQAAETMARQGCDVVDHGWRWLDYHGIDEATEREHIRLSVETIQRLTGTRPIGWYIGTPSANTRRLVVEEGGFLYDSDAYNDELPYWTYDYGRPHLIIPHTLDDNDTRLARGLGWGQAEDFFVSLRDNFDALHREGEQTPKIMTVALHCRLAGKPARAAAFARFVDHILRYDQVWICRRNEIAEHWWGQNPARDSDSALVWKIHLLHGAQTWLVQNAAITGDAPGTLSCLGAERIQGQCAALLKIAQEIPVSLQACHGGQRGEPGRGGPGILLRL